MWGFKERFEIYYGVWIIDDVLIAAVKFLDRYILDRFLFDKVIDLIDEAAVFLRIEIDFMFIELDEIIRKIMQLRIEKNVL